MVATVQYSELQIKYIATEKTTQKQNDKYCFTQVH